MMHTLKINTMAGMVLLAGGLTAAQAAETLQVKPGLWQVDRTMELGAMPFPPKTVRYHGCIKPGDPEGVLAITGYGRPDVTNGCKIIDKTITINSYQAKLLCQGEPPGPGIIDIKVKGDSLVSEVLVGERIPGSTRWISFKDESKYLGACPPPEKAS